MSQKIDEVHNEYGTPCLDHPIDRGEWGNPVTVDINAWTNGKPDGSNDTFDLPVFVIDGFQIFMRTRGDYATVGFADRTDAGWTVYNNLDCNYEARLYCMEK